MRFLKVSDNKPVNGAKYLFEMLLLFLNKVPDYDLNHKRCPKQNKIFQYGQPNWE